MTTGEMIKAARRKAGLTQAQLAEKLGIAYQTVAQWENDLRNPKLDTLQRIAAALDIPVTELIDDWNAIDTEDVAENAGRWVKTMVEQKKGGQYPHEHFDKCLRLNYSGSDDLIEEGIRIIAEKYREFSV